MYDGYRDDWQDFKFKWWLFNTDLRALMMENDFRIRFVIEYSTFFLRFNIPNHDQKYANFVVRNWWPVFHFSRLKIIIIIESFLIIDYVESCGATQFDSMRTFIPNSSLFITTHEIWYQRTTFTFWYIEDRMSDDDVDIQL